MELRMKDKDCEAFWGTDPLAAEMALDRLAVEGPEIIRKLLPLDSPWPGHSWHSHVRLTRLCKLSGADVVPHLLDIIRNGAWHAKIAVSPCFAAFVGNSAVGEATYALLSSGDIDVQRIAIEALGYAAYGSGYSIAETARFGRPGPNASFIDKYTMAKLTYYSVQALLRIFAHSGKESLLQQCQELVDDFQKVRSDDFAWDIDAVMGELEPIAADALIKQWLTGENDHYRRRALVGLAHLRLRRTVPSLARYLDLESTGVAAGIALGNIVRPEAGKSVAKSIADGVTSPGVSWALSALYALKIDWPDCSKLAFSIAQGDDEVATQMRYSLALRGDRSVLRDLERRLDGDDPFDRGVSALSLARLLGAAAKPVLTDREKETSNPVESLLVLAALIHLGRHDLVGELDRTLQKFPLFINLRPIWKREVLAAIVVAEGPESKRATLWAEIARENLSRALRDLEALGVGPGTDNNFGNGPRMDNKRTASVFVSYSHKDSNWLEKFQVALKPLVRKGAIDLWDDTRLRPGSNWKDSIDIAMQQANVALLLASQNFLNSDFVVQHELKTLLAAARTKGTKILWVAIDHALYEETELNDIQAANSPRKPLVDLSGAQQKKEIVRICREVRDSLNP
jgi:TIR domain